MAMDYFFSEEEQMMIKTAKTITREKMKPFAVCALLDACLSRAWVDGFCRTSKKAGLPWFDSSRGRPQNEQKPR